MYRDNIWEKICDILKRNNDKMLCPSCYGVKKYTYTTKRINVHVCDASDTITVTDYCPTCEGKGKLNNYDINFFVDKFELLRYYGDIKTNKHFISIRDILK
jgi:RecJ-like exonuclease